MNKKLMTICAFAVGATIFTTAAFADVVVGSGYYGLKTAAKTTTAKLTKEVENFTFEGSATIKMDGEILTSQSALVKYDMVNKRHEDITNTIDKKEGASERYFYTDANKYISKDTSSGEENYYVSQRSVKDYEPLTDPFDEEVAKDFEKVVDAFVGGMKDVVQIEENDGSKIYTGSLSNSQIPTFVNAVASFGLKYSIFESYQVKRWGLSPINSDIYLKDVNGKAVENKDGIIESAIGNATVVGTDENGNEHEFNIQIDIKISDINQTVVNEPNLEGKKVNYGKEYSEPTIDQKFVGTYKNDIVIEENNSFKKIGERIFEITSVQDESITANYKETYIEGYAPKDIPNFAVTGTKQEHGTLMLEYTEDGVKKFGQLSINYRGDNSAKDINVQFGVEFRDDKTISYTRDMRNFDSQFSRQFN